MHDDIMALQKRIAELEREIEVLRAKVTFFDRSPWMRDGIRGEQIVAELIGGETTAVTERFDVLATAGRLRLEVKYSNLNTAVAGGATRRWQWVRPLGFDGQKTFDALILIGEVDLRHQHLYRDPSAPYGVFDIPFSRIAEIVKHSSQMIQISTNPKKARTPVARLLYEHFQTTCNALSAKYRNV
jgi:hypothetical protein